MSIVLVCTVYYALLHADCAALWCVLVQSGLTALHVCNFGGHLHVMRSLVKEFNVNPDVVDKVSMMLCHLWSCMSAITVLLSTWDSSAAWKCHVFPKMHNLCTSIKCLYLVAMH